MSLLMGELAPDHGRGGDESPVRDRQRALKRLTVRRLQSS